MLSGFCHVYPSVYATMSELRYKVGGSHFFLCFMSLSYFSAPMHSLAEGHHSMHVGFISRVIVFLHDLHEISTSSDQISFTVSHQKHCISSGNGVLISLLPGQLSLNIIYLHLSFFKSYHWQKINQDRLTTPKPPYCLDHSWLLTGSVS